MKKKKTAELNSKPGKLSVLLKDYFLPGLMLIFIVLLTTFKISGDDDIFWHLQTGKYITENKTIPSEDVFGFVTEGQKWIPFEWGFDVLIYNIYSVSGYPGISLFRTLIFLLMFLLLIKVSQKLKLNIFISYIIFILLAAGLFERMLIKPQIISYLFSVLLLYLLISFQYNNENKKLIYFIPVLFLLWANMHMGVLSGFVILTIYIITEIIRLKKNKSTIPAETRKPIIKKLTLIYMLSAAALLVNPHGFNTYLYVYMHMQMKMLSEVFEWYSPFSSLFGGTIFIYVYYSFLALSAFSFFFLFRQKQWFLFSVLLVFLLLSFRNSRFAVDYMAVSAGIIVIAAGNLISRSDKLSVKNNPVYTYIPALILLAGIILLPGNNLYKLLNFERESGFGIYKSDYPQSAVEFIRKNNIISAGNRVFNSFGCGGFLIWEVPSAKNFIDSRNLNDEIYYSYKKINNKQPGFEDEFGKYNFNYILWFFPKLPYFTNEMKTSVISYLFANSDAWKLVFWDDNSFVFVRNMPEYKDIIEKFEYKYANPYYYTIDKEPLKIALKNDPAGVTSEIQRKLKEDSESVFIKAMSKSFKVN
ncbi:MAG: hypothetical protein UZ05_CHB002001296 [Chlorobi bacterium OLB5]|nr:MAG: hypothetical protein UZ05_CHB002001296 [Chlorobi bacterium OLB5]